MMTLLGQAFTLAASCHRALTQSCHQIHDAYDRAGCFLWRSMMDDQFLALKCGPEDSSAYRKTAGYYDWLRSRASEWMYETLSTKGASGDVGPKPDIKPGLLNAAQIGASYATRVNWASPVMIGAVCLTAAFAVYAMTHAGVGHGTADVVGTIYGSSPNGKVAPKPD